MLVRSLPWHSNNNSYSCPKAPARPALGGEQRRGTHPHSGNQTQCGLLAVLKAPQEQQQVTLLVHQSLPETLCTQVTLIETLHLQRNEIMITSLIGIFGFKRREIKLFRFIFQQWFSSNLGVGDPITDGLVFSFHGDLCKCGLCTPQLALQVGQSVFKGGPLLTQWCQPLRQVRILHHQPFHEFGWWRLWRRKYVHLTVDTRSCTANTINHVLLVLPSFMFTLVPHYSCTCWVLCCVPSVWVCTHSLCAAISRSSFCSSARVLWRVCMRFWSCCLNSSNSHWKQKASWERAFVPLHLS